MRLCRIISRSWCSPFLRSFRPQPRSLMTFVPPAFGGAEGFQQFGLDQHEIRLLIVAGHAGIAVFVGMSSLPRPRILPTSS